MKKILLVTFSDNADHQDTLFGIYEELTRNANWDPYLVAIREPKVPLQSSKRTWLVDCPKRPGITKKTFDFRTLFSWFAVFKVTILTSFILKVCIHGTFPSC